MKITLCRTGLLLSLAILSPGRHAAGGLADDAAEPADARGERFIDEYEVKVRPLEIAARPAPGGTPTPPARTRTSQAKEEAQNRSTRRSPTAHAFAELKKLQGGQDRRPDPGPRRSTCSICIYLEKQVDPALLKQITAKSNEIEKAFNVYRAKVGRQAN